MAALFPSDPVGDRPAPLRDGIALSALSAILYLALGQTAFHGVDAHEFMQRLGTGEPWHRYHFLYLPVVWLLCQVLEPLGVSTFEAARAASALGMALGVLGLHRAAAVLGARRGDAAILALLCATAPAALFFATVVEVHGVFHAFVGLGWWMAARAIRRPGPGRAVALGVATGLATGTHATGHLFFGLVMLVWLVDPRDERRSDPVRVAGYGLLAVVAHLGVVSLCSLLQQEGVEAEGMNAQIEMVVQSLRKQGSPQRWAEIFVHEWLLGYAPMSLAVFVGLAVRATRRLAAATLVAIVAYYVPTAIMFVFYGTDEWGAYFLPLAFPTAIVLLRLVPRPLALVVAAAGAAIGVTWIVQHDHPGRSDRYALDLLEALGDERPVLFYGDTEEGRAMMRVDAAVRSFNIIETINTVRDLPQPPEARYQGFCALFDAQVAAAAQRREAFVLTESCYRLLQSPALPDFAVRFAREHLPARYRIEPVRHGEFSGWVLRPR